MLFATSQARVAIRLADAFPPAPVKVALIVLAVFWYSAGVLPAAIHGMDAPLTADTVNAGTLPGSANVRLAGGAEPT
jgi:hypothetical protein